MGMLPSFHVLAVHAHYSLFDLTGCKVTTFSPYCQIFPDVFVSSSLFFCKLLHFFQLFKYGLKTSYYQHALKGQKLLAQGNALGYHIRKLVAL